MNRLLGGVCLVASIFSAAAAHAADTKICISTWDQTNPYWVDLVRGAKEQAEANGAELVVNDPYAEVSKQLEALENFTALNCNAIIIAALNPEATRAALTEARARGIKIVAQSMELPVADIWVSADERDMGYTIGVEAGNWIKEKLGGEAEVLILNNDRNPQVIARKEGMKEGIAEKAPNARIVADQPALNTQEGMQVTESVLQANPDLNVIVGHNDSSALGALAAVESADRSSDTFFIGGVDATAEAKDRIEAGTAFRASVDNVPYENGKLDVDLALKLIKGEEVEYKQVVPVKVYRKQ
ncbi:sugar ABC transporter substrate-binding protein [Shinella daejeonensis]|uniref:sugar ABC transporter substrate-binding protein n=1 Tax=Shinella daejeonensis TaxID=659017 RepID=UPI0020C7EC7F|nr:sugar ABC transporter substrate-binding protein [Shinella daejeonensis]MCP8894577.1 sugar ABC transporter substrate-binding protein [Shinella daejeonensis]